MNTGHFSQERRLVLSQIIDPDILRESESASFGDYELEPEEEVVVDVGPGLMAFHRPQLFDLVEEACSEINSVYGNCGPLRLEALFVADRERVKIRCREAREDENACAVPPLRKQDLWVPRTAGEVRLSVEVGYLQPPVEVAEQ